LQELDIVVKSILADSEWAPEYHVPVEPKPYVAPEPEPEAEAVTEAEAEPAPEPEPEPEQEPEPEPELAPEPEPVQETTEELTRTQSEVIPLTRTLSSNTTSNREDLVAWLDAKSKKWAEGEKPTPADYSEGHMLVYTICSDSSSPKDAEASCYILYCDYVRGAVTQFPEDQQKSALKALQTVFKYLDQHYTNPKKVRKGGKTSKVPTSKLAVGQSLKEAAEFIKADHMWTPDYVIPTAAAPVEPEAAPEAETASLSRTDSLQELQRTVSNKTVEGLDNLRAWIIAKCNDWSKDPSQSCPQDLAEGHHLVYTVCTEAGQAKNTERLCYEMYIEFIRGVAERERDPEQRAAAKKVLGAIFRYLDQHWTKTKRRTDSTTKTPTSKLVPGQDLSAAADAIFGNITWTPTYQAMGSAKETAPRSISPSPSWAAGSGAGDGSVSQRFNRSRSPAPRKATEQNKAEPEEELTRTYSAVNELTRTVSSKTQSNLDELKEFLAEHATAWATAKPTVDDVSAGHALVFKACSDSSAPRDAEFQCFDMFLDYSRGAVDSFEGEERQQALRSLQKVFRYLDQHYCDTKPRPGAKTTKQATSKLATGQKLKYCAEMIEADVNWLPLFYTTSSAPDGTPMAEPADSKRKATPVEEPVAEAPAAAAAVGRYDDGVVTPAQRYKSISSREAQQKQNQRQREIGHAYGLGRPVYAHPRQDPAGYRLNVAQSQPQAGPYDSYKY